MFQVSETFYSRFLPAVIDTAAEKGPDIEKKYREMVKEELLRPEHKLIEELH